MPFHHSMDGLFGGLDNHIMIEAENKMYFRRQGVEWLFRYNTESETGKYISEWLQIACSYIYAWMK